MPRDLPIGNGTLLVAFDSHYRLADFYYPRVGMENQIGAKFRLGIWCDGALHATDEEPWQRTLDYLRDTLVTDVTLRNDEIGVRLRCYDAVDPDANVYVRRMVVRNMRDDARDVKLFLHHDFALYGNSVGDTVFFDPRSKALVQYKGRRYMLINTDHGVPEYACGRSATTGAEGTWIDAQDGQLSMSAIAQGTVDATIGVPVHLEPHGSATLLYWICVGKSDAEVRGLDAMVRDEGPAQVLARTGSHWYTWVNKSGDDLSPLPEEIIDLYRRSLLVIATQCDRNGAVLAANDSDIQWGHNDHYSYVWPRDAAFVCDAMGRAGFPEFGRRFLHFANDVIRNEGYFLHKYNPDGSPAPLWIPWLRNGKPQLPVQEDETALVTWLVARHYERTRDLDTLRAVYPRLVVSAANFLESHRDRRTGLPLPSFDLWEERQGVFTFTCAAVWAGLHAAAELANLFNDQEHRSAWAKAADEVRDAMRRHLWMEQESRFARGLLLNGADELELDPTVDASAFALFHLGVFAAESALVDGTMRAVREKLTVPTDVGGVARYENDAYHRISADERITGNPWILCTLWLAEHDVASARDGEGVQAALDRVRWARARATESMILPEQIDPYDGQHLSVAPLTWSHAQVVSVVQSCLEARRRAR